MAIALPAWGRHSRSRPHRHCSCGSGICIPRIRPTAVGRAVFMSSIRVHYYSHAQHLTNKTWSLLATSCPAVLINVVMNFVLLPQVGIIGAIWARLASYVVALGISLWLCRRQLRLPFQSGVQQKRWWQPLPCVAFCWRSTSRTTH